MSLIPKGNLKGIGYTFRKYLIFKSELISVLLIRFNINTIQMKTFKRGISVIFFALFSFLLTAQIPEQLVKVIVTPNKDNWLYKPGEKALFSVQVLFHYNPLKGVKAYYEVGPEKLEPTKKDSLVLDGKSFVIDGGTLKSPGFLRCIVTVNYEGKKYEGMATAGYDPEKIKQTVPRPADFNDFWNKAKSELSRIPLDARMTLVPERCTEKVNVYNVSIMNYGYSRIYGMLAIPRKEGKFPAVLFVPGAGVRGYVPDMELAEKGIITFVIGIHGIPVNLDPGVYQDLANGALREYYTFNLDNKDRYYYKRVYLGCVRANDFLVSLPQYDGSNLAVTGGSQGGALSIITAALDSRTKYLAALYPALCDVTGYLEGRAGGWPHLFLKNNASFHNYKEKLETIPYYDVVNFARELKIPGFYTWGFNDEVCPPTSMYAAYNLISSPKTLLLIHDTGHWAYPEQHSNLRNWLTEKLGIR